MNPYEDLLKTAQEKGYKGEPDVFLIVDWLTEEHDLSVEAYQVLGHPTKTQFVYKICDYRIHPFDKVLGNQTYTNQVDAITEGVATALTMIYQTNSTPFVRNIIQDQIIKKSE